jgi:N-acetylmuramoyl-L-alanine amidase
MKICLDPGHGGHDWGASIQHPFKYTEKEFSLVLAQLTAGKLESSGYSVMFTRSSDIFIPLETRALLANAAGADVFLSIHANASSDPASEGMEVFYYPGSENGRSLANLTLQSLLEECPGHIDRGIKEAKFVVLELTNMPAALVECEFISNPRQAAFLRNPENQRKLATAIARGVHIFSR